MGKREESRHWVINVFQCSLPLRLPPPSSATDLTYSRLFTSPRAFVYHAQHELRVTLTSRRLTVSLREC
jgi:hypothetical protein